MTAALIGLAFLGLLVALVVLLLRETRRQAIKEGARAERGRCLSILQTMELEGYEDESEELFPKPTQALERECYRLSLDTARAVLVLAQQRVSNDRTAPWDRVNTKAVGA